jgi:VWFA-related protein
VNLVLIDVVVRDRKDRPLSGLRREDFELFVDRKPIDPSNIESFEEVCPAPAEGTAPSGQAATPAAPAPTAAGTTPVRHIVLYLDFSQMSLAGHRQALKAARDQVAVQVGPSDRVMILAFKRSLRLVQDFTSDAALLASRLNEMLDDVATVDTDVLEERHQMTDVAGKACDGTGSTCVARRELAATYAHMEQARARRSLAAIEGLMPALAGIRGRKALILFTDALRDEPGIQYLAIARSTAGEVGINIKEELLRLTREANAAGVSLYTVHASGLDDTLTSEFRDAHPENSSITAEAADGGGMEITRSATGADQGQLYTAAASGLDAALSIQTTLATETGGKALQRTNNLGAILATAWQDLSCYYLLGYRYQGSGDGARHSLLVRVKPGPEGEPRRGLTIRHRPYYTDTSPGEREQRLLQSAMQAPDLFRSFPITTEAFALAPEDSRRQVLVKATVPLESLSLTPAGPDQMSGRALIMGEVRETGGGDPVCSFRHEIPVTVPRRPDAASRLIFETGCLIEPGNYELALAVLDPTTHEVGARRSPLTVPASGTSARQAYVSEVYLWARDERAILVAAGAENVGLKDRASTTAFVPRSERRLAKGEPATLSFLFCPAEGENPTPGSPIRLRRSLLGEGNATVSDFDDLLLSAPPDGTTGCYQIVNAIPPGTLGDGIYRFTIQISGATLGEPIVREAALAVD